MIDALERQLQSQWTALLPGEDPPDRVRIAVVATSREPAGTRILLVFADNAAQPAMVAKVPRHPALIKPLEREWGLLEQLDRSIPASIRGTLPQPLLRLELCGLPVYVQSALPGQNLKTLLQRGQRQATAARVARDLERLDRWLEPFQSVVPFAETLDALGIERLDSLVAALEPLLPPLIDGQVVTKTQAELLVAHAASVDRHLRDEPLCWVHGDLWPGNVLIEGGLSAALPRVEDLWPIDGLPDGERWAVLDWDGALVGPRWLDRYWFAVHYGMLAHAQLLSREDLAEGLRRTLFMSHPVSAAVGDYLRRTSRGMPVEGLPHRVMLTLLLALEAGRTMRDEGRKRVFDRQAPGILREWLSYPEQVRI